MRKLKEFNLVCLHVKAHIWQSAPIQPAQCAQCAPHGRYWRYSMIFLFLLNMSRPLAIDLDAVFHSNHSTMVFKHTNMDYHDDSNIWNRETRALITYELKDAMTSTDISNLAPAKKLGAAPSHLHRSHCDQVLDPQGTKSRMGIQCKSAEHPKYIQSTSKAHPKQHIPSRMVFYDPQLQGFLGFLGFWH